MDATPGLYACMFESAPVALCVTDGDGRILLINPALERLLGWSPSEQSGQLLAYCLRQAIVDPAQTLCWTVALSEALTLGKTTYLSLPAEFRIGVADGHLQPLAGVILPYQSGADLRGAFIMFHGHGLMESAEAARIRFFSAVSHELGTPVSNIASAAELLSRYLDPDNPQKQRLIRTIRTEVARLRRLMDQFLAVSPAQGRTSPMSGNVVTLRPLICQAAQTFDTREAGHRIVVAVPPDLPFVWGDTDAIHEVLSDLLENALRYSPPGAEITLAAEGRSADVLISVRDQGPGVPAEDREQLFEPFHWGRQGRESATGQGFGLTIALSLVEQLGGELWYEDQPAGPRFCFTLPRAPGLPDAGE